MKPEEKKLLILAALEKVLKDRRFDEVTVDEVAVAAGVGKGTVYRHFGDKENLFFEMVRHLLDEKIVAVTAVAGSTLAPREKLIRVGEVMSEYIQKHGEFVHMMLSIPFSSASETSPRDVMGAHHAKLDAILKGVLDEARVQGVTRDEDDSELVVCMFKGVVLSRSFSKMHRGMEFELASLVDMMLTGIGAGT